MKRGTASLSLATAGLLVLAACGSNDKAASPAAASAATAPAGSAAVSQWPSSLRIVGDGFPADGDPCRVVGESAATSDYLDDSATLVGCPSAADAGKLGGRKLAVVDGITLVSVPRMAMPGDGDSQGDAKVPGAKYHATAQVRCAGYKGAGAGLCEAGVVRDAETGPYVEVKLPDGMMRTIFFEKSGKFLSFATAQADGTAAMKITSRREGDTTIAMMGSERYEIPDVLLSGD